MTFPEETPNSKPVSFNPAIPTVTSISGYGLEKLGWIKMGLTWTKEDQSITYDGTNFRYNNQIIKFLEEIK